MTQTGEIECASDLRQQLISMRLAAHYDVFAQICLYEQIKSMVDGELPNDPSAQINGQEVRLSEFLRSLNEMGETAALETKRNANRFLTRNHLKEVFRLTQSYATKAGSINRMKEEGWYEFARIVVNCFSHNHRLIFNSRDRNVLPVEFCGVIIEENMEGKPIQANLDTMLQLSDCIIDFACQRLD